MRHTSEEKRERLLYAAAGIFAEKGYEQTSIKAITTQADVSVGTFYIYFENKEAILLALYQQIRTAMILLLEEQMQAVYPDTTTELLVCTVSMLCFYQKYEKLSLILLTKTIALSRASERAYYQFFYQLSQTIATILRKLEIQGQLAFPDLDIAATAYLQILNGLAAQWLAAQDGKTLSQVIQNVVTYNFKALSIPFEEAQLAAAMEAYRD